MRSDESPEPQERCVNESRWPKTASDQDQRMEEHQVQTRSDGGLAFMAAYG